MPSIPPHANVTKLTRENAEVWMLEMYSLLSIYGWEVVIDRGQLQTTMSWLEGATARCVDQSKLRQRTQPVRHRLPPGPSTPTVQRPAQTYWTQQQGLQRDAEAESTACAGQAPGGGGQGGGGARTPVVTRSAGPQLGESSLVGTPLPVSSSATNALSSGEDLDLHQTQTAEVLATLASRHAQHEPSITELEELVTTSNDANLEALRRIEVQVLAFMMLCISPALRYHFAAYAYAQDIWDEVEGWVVTANELRGPTLMLEMKRQKMRAGDFVTTYFDGIRHQAKQLIQAGIPVTEQQCTEIAIAGAAPRFTALQVLYSSPDLSVGFSATQLRYEQADIANQRLAPDHPNFPPYLLENKAHANPPPPAFPALAAAPAEGRQGDRRNPGYGGKAKRGGGNPAQSPRGRGGGGNGNSAVCSHCHFPGHVQDTCWKLHPNLRPARPGQNGQPGNAPRGNAPRGNVSRAEFEALSS